MLLYNVLSYFSVSEQHTTHRYRNTFFYQLLLKFVADIQIVALGQSITITPYFHQRARIIFPMILHTRYIHVGKSSFTLEETITDAEHGDVLFSNRRLIALMNASTGASEKMTEKFR